MSATDKAIRSLRFKFVFAVSSVLLLTLLASSFYLYRAQQTQLLERLDDKTEALSQFISLTSPASIHALDIGTIDNIIGRLNNDIDVEFALLLNPDGEMLSTVTPAGRQPQQLIDIVEQGSTQKRQIHRTPIHSANEQLGELVIAINPSRTLAVNRSNMILLLLIYLCIILFLAAVIFLIFHFHVLRPIKHLIQGANHLSSGDYDYRVPVLSQDELGQLATCFNRMTDEINREQMQFKQANEQLAREIEQRRQAQDQMQLAASVFTHAREGIIITDPDARIIDTNNAFTQITGYTRDEVIGKNPRILQSGRQDKTFYRNMWHSLINHGHWNGEIWNRRKNGSEVAELVTISAVLNAEQKVQHYVALFSDITSQKEHQQQLEYIAHYDSLTGLPNRMLLADRLQQALAQANRNHQSLTVAYLDLDGFKEINDRYGHDMGDQLLVTLANRMNKSVRDSDTLARLGGDEFIAVLNNCDEADSRNYLERILLSAAQPITIDQVEMQVSASIGVTYYPQEQEVDADQLLRQADQAMYRAKLDGKNRFYSFDPAEDQGLRGHNENVSRIRQALDNNELVLHYHPKVNLYSGEVKGVEALIRWNHPERGLLNPNFFLPFIDQHPLMSAIGDWVIDSCLRQMDLWRAGGLEISVSINIDSFHIQQELFAQRLSAILARYPEVNPRLLQLEIMETTNLELAQVSDIMHQCRALGVELVLDNFGAGYSSLNYLKNLPINAIKIDRSFVRDMLNNPENLAIVEGVIGLAQAFRLDVVAEGIESPEHGEFVLMIGCELAQGFFIAAPMASDKLPFWISQWRSLDLWRTTPTIPAQAQQMLFTIVEYRAWSEQLHAFVSGQKSEIPPLEEIHQRFTNWLDEEGARLFGKQPGFDSIRSDHQEIHALARKMIEDYRNDSQQDTIEQMQQLFHLRDQLTDSIKKVLRGTAS